MARIPKGTKVYDDGGEKASPSTLSDLASVVVTLPIYVLVIGWSISTTWLWFVVPLGLPAIGVFHAAGLRYIALLFTRGIPGDSEDETFVEALSRCAWCCACWAVAVGMLWVIHELSGLP